MACLHDLAGFCHEIISAGVLTTESNQQSTESIVHLTVEQNTVKDAVCKQLHSDMNRQTEPFFPHT